MTSTDLPDHHAFSVRSALEQGVSPERLRTTRIPAPFPGVRSFTAPRRGADLPPEQRHLAHLELCRAYAQRMAPAQFFSHLSAAHLLDAPLPARLRWDEVHVGVRPPDRAPRVAGVVGHRLAGLSGDPMLIEGLAVVSPADMWCQLGPMLSIDELIAVGDHLVRERGASGRWRHQRLPARCSLDDLTAALSGSRHLGAGSLRAAFPQIRAGSESPKETELRLAFVRAGLPEPVLNHELRDRRGRFIARLDLAYPVYRAAFEYDGRQHATDPGQFAKDVDRIHAVTRLGWSHDRFLAHHLQAGAAVAIDRARERLIAAGWRP